MAIDETTLDAVTYSFTKDVISIKGTETSCAYGRDPQRHTFPKYLSLHQPQDETRTSQNAQSGSTPLVMPFMRLVVHKPPNFLLQPPQDTQRSI